MSHKIEARGSLWMVTFTNGCYSGVETRTLLFAGNNEDEVWHFVKQYAIEGGEILPYTKTSILVRDAEAFFIYDEAQTAAEMFAVADIVNGKPHIGEKEIQQECDYGNGARVEITRANVIYVNP